MTDLPEPVLSPQASRTSRQNTWALYLLRAALHFIVFAGLVCYLAWIFIWEDPRYDYFTGYFGDDAYNLYYQTGAEKGTTVVHGYSLIIVAYQWCAILAAVYALAVLGALPKLGARGAHDTLQRLRIRARAFAKWQTPCHRVWVYWCGGMSAADVLVIAIYLALHVFWFLRLTQYNEEYYDALRETGVPFEHSLSLTRLERYALDFGVMLWPSLLLLFFPMSHVSFLADWLGTHYADMIRWHRWIGHGTMWLVSIHGILYYIYWGCIQDFWHNFADWSTISSINFLAGTIAWIFGLALWATSVHWVRRNFFEIYYRFHIGCFIMFVVFSTIHYGNAWTWWLPGLIIYGIDIVLRAGQSLNATTITAYGSEDNSLTTMEVKLARNFKCKGNEELFVMIPQISSWQWHPFTVYEVRETAAGSKKAIMHCKVYNAWTTELCKRSQLHHPLAARIVGPLGRRRDDALWLDYATVVLIGGGIGAIPVLSMLKDILKNASASSVSIDVPLKPPKGLKKVIFVWVSRHGSEFILIEEDLLQCMRSCSWLEVSFYITSPLREGPALSLADSPKHSFLDTRWLPLTHSWASPFKLSSDRPAQARMGGFVMEVLVATLAFAGGFFGTVLGYAYNADGTYTGAADAYSYYWKSGMVLLACQTVMILGLPYALVIFPRTMYQAWRDRRERQQLANCASNGSESHESDEQDLKQPHLSLETLMSKVASVHYSRPDVFAIIGKAVKEEKGHVGIFAGGPSSLRAAVSNASYSMRQKCNLFGRLVHYFDESHEL